MANIRPVIFYGVFAILLIFYLLIVTPFGLGNTAIPIGILEFSGNVAPYIISDLGFIGSYSPPILAAAMAGAAPTLKQPLNFYTAIGFSAITYVAYIHLSYFLFGTGSAGGNLWILVTGDIKSTILQLVDGVRTFSIVVAAAMVGLKANPQHAG